MLESVQFSRDTDDSKSNGSKAAQPYVLIKQKRSML